MIYILWCSYAYIYVGLLNHIPLNIVTWEWCIYQNALPERIVKLNKNIDNIIVHYDIDLFICFHFDTFPLCSLKHLLTYVFTKLYLRKSVIHLTKFQKILGQVISIQERYKLLWMFVCFLRFKIRLKRLKFKNFFKDLKD